jgi:hypothetical protein
VLRIDSIRQWRGGSQGACKANGAAGHGVSFGMSVYEYDGRTAQDLPEAADRELYQQAKSACS